jgi:hypothetical protein
MATNPITLKDLLDLLRSAIAAFPDTRTGENRKYELEEIALSAFSVFFMQNPSFLAHQKTMKTAKGRSNAQTVFGIREIPCDNQIRNVLDPVSPEHVDPVFEQVYERLWQSGCISSLRTVGGWLLIALDGTRYFSSKEIGCTHCSTTLHKDGTVTYFHSMLTPVIVSPGTNMAFSLSPEFITPQDGSDKQDCETNAGKRWLDRCGESYKDAGAVILGDDLYSRQPFCEKILSKGLGFILVCKPDSHKSLYEWLRVLEEAADMRSVVVRRWNGRFWEIYTYKYANGAPLRDTDDALAVNWAELTIAGEDGRIIYKNAFATNLAISDKNVEAIVDAGRTRWKVENENNNTLKTKGYNLEHNFGHGKDHLSSLLAALNLLAFLFHTVMDLAGGAYALVRKTLPSRKTFFNDLKALTRYFCFESWDHVIDFMIQGLELDHPAPG